MTNPANRAVPPHLRPSNWNDLCLQLAMHGWSSHDAGQRLARAAARAETPRYIAVTIADMLRETPPAPQPTLTPPPPPQLRLEPHPYQPDPVCQHAGGVDPNGVHHHHPGCYAAHCARCGLPPHNRHHT